MTQRIIKFGGIDPLTRTESPHGDSEPDEDPRGRQGTEIVTGVHMMSAVEQLEPAKTTSMLYIDPDSPLRELDAAEIEAGVRDGEWDLADHVTRTDRFTPLVNPRRSRLKRQGKLSSGADADLWHVPTSNYQALPPRQIFRPLAESIDANDAIEGAGVHGEFRERRNGGEVHGDVWFRDFNIGQIDGDPVWLGMKFRWNYFGDIAFAYQPWAQRTRCKNSVAPLDDWTPVMHHNRSVNFREFWDEALRDLGLLGDDLSLAIRDAHDIVFAFDSEPGEDEDGVLPVPMDLEDFYEHAGFPDPKIPAEHAREEADASANPEESADRISAWTVHNGATYWLSWHWDGSESSRAFREYRTAANDLLFNPDQMVSRVENAFEQEQEQRAVRSVLGEGRTIEDASEDELAEIEARLADNEAVATVRATSQDLSDMVDRFEDTEERLDRIQGAIGG